ncbi:hypothetical protein [Acidithiobacillus ferrianus]|uniref:hypothetical protein n=1 Tax=Acidithiobacillus ferrianus TaxID=2678518 RepID=UPI0034E4DB51
MDANVKRQATQATDQHENGLDLAAIDPRNGPQFSPNLYRFLKGRGQTWATTCRVYLDMDGILRIGSLDDGWLHGAWLMGVLCYGLREQVWAHLPGSLGDLREITDFWTDYMRNGRCAIDPEHKRSFIGDETRWAVHGDERSCLWCGDAHQKLETWVEEVRHERLVTA